MKIIYLHQYFNTPQMVGGTRSYEMGRRLVERGHSVDLITSDRTSSKGEFKGWIQTIEAGICVHWVNIPYSNSMSYKKRLIAFIKFLILATLKASSMEADIIFATSTPLTIAFPAIFLAKRKKIPMVFEVRDLWPQLPIAAGVLKGWLPIQLALWLERYAYRNADRIVALSPGMKEGIMRTGYPDNKVSVIPNSADLDLFDVPITSGQGFRTQFEWLQDRPLVVYTGTIGLINGVDYMARLAAFVIKIDPEIRFLIFGEGKKKHYVRAVAEDLGVLNLNFFMMEPIPKNEISKVISAADIATSLFIDLPEMWANSANKFFDALASGTPLAINYKGWQAELLQEMEAGIILDAENVKGAAKKLVQTLHDRKWLKKASVAARKLAEDRFSRDMLAKKLEDVLLNSVKR